MQLQRDQLVRQGWYHAVPAQTRPTTAFSRCPRICPSLKRRKLTCCARKRVVELPEEEIEEEYIGESALYGVWMLWVSLHCVNAVDRHLSRGLQALMQQSSPWLQELDLPPLMMPCYSSILVCEVLIVDQENLLQN